MKNFILFIYLGSILTSVVTAFIFRKGLRSRKLSALVPYLALVFLQELSLFFYLRQFPSASTGIVYNIYNPVTLLIFGYIYYRLPFNTRLNKLIVILAAVYMLVVLVSYNFLTSIFVLNSRLSVLAGFFITCYGILFLFNYFGLDSSGEEKFWRPLLIMTIGIVIFYPVIGISFAFHKQLLAYEATFYGLKLYQIIPQVMSIFLYGSFSYTFYLCKKIS